MFVSPYVSIRLNYRLLITSNRARGGKGKRPGQEARGDRGGGDKVESAGIVRKKVFWVESASPRRKAPIIALRLLSAISPRDHLLSPFGIALLVRGRELSASGYTLIRRGTRLRRHVTQWRIRVYTRDPSYGGVRRIFDDELIRGIKREARDYKRIYLRLKSSFYLGNSLALTQS